MEMKLDFYGHAYSADHPSFVVVDDNYYIHRPTKKLMGRASVDAQMEKAEYTPGEGEVGEDADWLAANYATGSTGAGDGGGGDGGGGDGGGDAEAPDVVATVTDLDVSVSWSGAGADVPAEVTWGDGSDPEYVQGDATSGAPNVQPATHTYAADGDYTISVDPEGDEFSPGTADVTVAAAEAPPPAEQNRDYRAMTTHANIDQWASSNGVTTPAGWVDMTIADKKSWLDANV